jgi:hypothetical protein
LTKSSGCRTDAAPGPTLDGGGGEGVRDDGCVAPNWGNGGSDDDDDVITSGCGEMGRPRGDAAANEGGPSEGEGVDCGERAMADCEITAAVARGDPSCRPTAGASGVKCADTATSCPDGSWS